MNPVNYDLLFVTHLPAFYKINLYNALSKYCRVGVIFVAEGSHLRHEDFTQADRQFDYYILNHGPFEKRSVFNSVCQLNRLLKKICARRIILGGWDLIEFWWIVFLYGEKTWVAVESSRFESQLRGIRALIKRFFLKRVQGALVSGQPHRELLQTLRFKKEMKQTQGVGEFRYGEKAKKIRDFQGQFLYVGRIATEKNIPLLLEVFKILPQFSLTLIGEGPLFDTLKKETWPNVTFLGHISNEKLPLYYQDHDALILPSLKEPWGLVVEEALYYGLPVIVSNQVGCHVDMVKVGETGEIFSPNLPDSLVQALLKLAQAYPYYQTNVAQLDFKARDAHQVQQYLACLL